MCGGCSAGIGRWRGDGGVPQGGDWGGGERERGGEDMGEDRDWEDGSHWSLVVEGWGKINWSRKCR